MWTRLGGAMVGWWERLSDGRRTLSFAAGLALLLAGAGAAAGGRSGAAALLWTVGTLLGLGLSLVTTVAAVRRRQPSVDVIALLALVGALLVDEPFAGAMITVMLATGALLYWLGWPSAEAGHAVAGVAPMLGPGLAGISARGTF